MENPEGSAKQPRPEAAKSTLPQPGRPVPNRAYPGALIVVEGTDGSGKSTQLYLLKRWLEIGGYRLHFTEWTSLPPSKPPLVAVNSAASSPQPLSRFFTPRTSPTAASARSCHCFRATTSCSPTATSIPPSRATVPAAARPNGFATSTASLLFLTLPSTSVLHWMSPSIASSAAAPNSSTTKPAWTSAFPTIVQKVSSYSRRASSTDTTAWSKATILSSSTALFP